MIFEWDEVKNRRNIAIRGIDFSDARRVLRNLVKLEIDERHDHGERRFVAYGIVDGRLTVCVYTKRGRVRRVISLRRANRRERNAYR